jgi:hypothetical protein
MDAFFVRIVQFCKGDKARAKQLLEQTKQLHPDQSELWCLQKVISDLEHEQAEHFQRRKAGKPSVNPNQPPAPPPTPPKSPQPVNSSATRWENLVKLRQAEHFRRQKTGKAGKNPPQPTTPEVIRPATPDKDLRQEMAQSLRDNPDRSESWHQQNAQRRIQQRPKQPQKQVASNKTLSVNYSSWNHLLRLLQGSESTAKRLIEGAKLHNPGRSDQWALEKVIFDLERDRR